MSSGPVFDIFTETQLANFGNPSTVTKDSSWGPGTGSGIFPSSRIMNVTPVPTGPGFMLTSAIGPSVTNPPGTWNITSTASNETGIVTLTYEYSPPFSGLPPVDLTNLFITLKSLSRQFTNITLTLSDENKAETLPPFRSDLTSITWLTSIFAERGINTHAIKSISIAITITSNVPTSTTFLSLSSSFFNPSGGQGNNEIVLERQLCNPTQQYLFGSGECSTFNLFC